MGAEFMSDGPPMTTRHLWAMLDLARETHCRLCWREATGEWSFVPLAENTVTATEAAPHGDADDATIKKIDAAWPRALFATGFAASDARGEKGRYGGPLRTQNRWRRGYHDPPQRQRRRRRRARRVNPWDQVLNNEADNQFIGARNRTGARAGECRMKRAAILLFGQRSRRSRRS